MNWRKVHVVPVHKRGEKQCLKNYKSISSLRICCKIFERLIYNELFTFFTDNNLISPNQSKFITGDSCVNELITITHKIYKSFDDGLEVRGVFLDISQGFDEVWYEAFLLKLILNGISGNLLKMLRYFLYYIKKWIALNGQNSSWENVEFWFLIMIWLSKRKRWYSVEKLRKFFTLVFRLMIFL